MPGAQSRPISPDLPSGSHTLDLATLPLDLSGQSPSPSYSKPFTIAPGTIQSGKLFEKPDAREVPISAAGNNLGFQGLETDPATGLIYMRNRWYDPELGRFITKDPMGYPDGPNGYAFVGGDPVNGGDPMGLYEEAGHYYTTLYVALALGWSAHDSLVLAFFSQLPDELSEFDAVAREEDAKIERFANTLRGKAFVQDSASEIRTLSQRALHALTGGSSALETARAREGLIAAPDLASAGVQAHRLADTFAHRRIDNPSLLYATGNGHLFDSFGVNPDLIQNRPNLYLTFVRNLASSLRKRGGDRRSSPDDIVAALRPLSSIAPTIEFRDRTERVPDVLMERSAIASLVALVSSSLERGSVSERVSACVRVARSRQCLCQLSRRANRSALNQLGDAT